MEDESDVSIGSQEQELDELLRKWRRLNEKRGATFAEDGIISIKEWKDAPRRILFLMKEPNNFCKDLRQLARNRPWSQIGRWAYGLQHTRIDSFPSFKEATDNHAIGCRSCAIMNLKKESGSGSSSMPVIKAAAIKDKEFILEEIGIIAPELVVCCGTFQKAARVILEEARLLPAGPDKRCFMYNGMVWIEYCHQKARWPHDMMYYGLVALYQNYLLATIKQLGKEDKQCL